MCPEYDFAGLILAEQLLLIRHIGKHFFFQRKKRRTVLIAKTTEIILKISFSHPQPNE